MNKAVALAGQAEVKDEKEMQRLITVPLDCIYKKAFGLKAFGLSKQKAFGLEATNNRVEKPSG